jgi:hypothetical protein
MTRCLRHLQRLVAGCALALGTPATAVTQTASVNASVVKPLTITAVQDLSLATVSLPAGAWSGAVVGISQNGAFACSAKVICTGTAQVARFKVTGTNKMAVRISVPNVTLVNQANTAKTLTLTVDSPSSVTLTSSGEPGITFGVGGSVTLDSTTLSGLYKGTINVTVDYP